MWVFLRLYDQYAREVNKRARQLVADDFVSAEVVNPVRLKYCVDSEWLESLIELEFIPDVTSYDELQDSHIGSYLDGKAEESKEVMTISVLDKLVENELRIDMSDKDARSRIETLFMSYNSLLRRNGLAWLSKDNEKISIFHVLSRIRPESPLRTGVRPRSVTLQPQEGFQGVHETCSTTLGSVSTGGQWSTIVK